jgi:hypothetical protein
MGRYVVVRVAYESDAPTGVRSLAWLLPELGDADLRINEDRVDAREWVGVIDNATYTRLADSWNLANQPEEQNLDVSTEEERSAGHVYTWDGMKWESGGSSPIIDVRLRVSDPVPRSADRRQKTTRTFRSRRADQGSGYRREADGDTALTT